MSNVCQGFQNTNLYTMITAPWYTEFCFPKTDLVQALTKTNSTELVDAIGTRDGTCFRGRGYEFDGGQYIDTGVKVQGRTPIDWKLEFIVTDLSTDHINLINCGGTTGSEQAIRLMIIKDTGVLYYFTHDGAGNYSTKNTGIVIQENTYNKFRVVWSGIAGENVTVTNNSDTSVSAASYDWTGDSYRNLQIGWLYGYARYLIGRLFNYSYTINGNPEVVHNCEEGALGVSYSTTPGITASINGTIAGFHVNDDRKTTCKLNTHGYSTCDSLPGVAIPLDDNYEPVITCV